jgi:hypothetical protein
MLGIISFSDRIAYNIKSNEHKDMILDQLNNLYNIKIIQRHHHDLDNNNIRFVLSNHHMLNLRSNGNRYYLYFTLYNDIEIIYFIDKKIHPGYQRPRIILGRGMFEKSLFKNTLLDGEMVKCKDNTWTFLINDMICYEGIYLNRKSLPERLKLIYNMIDKQYTPDSTIDVCNFKIKTYYYLYRNSIKCLIDMSKELNYTCRGIYFWSHDLRHKPKLYNFDETTIKNVIRKTKDKTEFQTLTDKLSSDEEEIGKNNIIITEQQEQKAFEINDGEKLMYLVKTNEPDIYKIFETENILNTKSIGIALVQSLITSRMLRNAFRDKNVTAFIKFKCIYNNKFEKWQPIEQIW